MQKIKIKIVALGNLKYPINFKTIEKWRSNIFNATYVDKIHVLENPDTDHWTYSDKQLSSTVQPDPNYDFTVGLINAPLAYNYYSRRFDNNVCIISIFEIADILKLSNLRLESFIIRVLYYLSCYYAGNNNKLPSSSHSSAHIETRGCLFDKTINKADIIFSTASPCICDPCKTRLMSYQLDKEFLPSLVNELRKIRKDLYFRITDFIKAHPLLSILITMLTGILLNVVASILYDLFVKKFITTCE